MPESNYEIEFEAKDIPLDRLPTPVGWRILIAPVVIKEKTSGGILLPETAKEVLEVFRTVGKVLKVGDDCYKHEKFPGKPWCKPGDIVQFSSYTGMESVICHNDEVCKLKLINDDEIVSVVSDPEILNFL